MRNRGVRSFVVFAICLGAVACRSASPTPPMPSKEVEKLEQLIGKWKSHSHHLARNIRSGVPDTDLTFTCASTADRNYVACSQSGEISGKQVKEVDIYGYSKADKLYTMVVVLDIADAPPRVITNWFAWEGKQWRFLPHDGIRATWEFQSPDHHITRTERTEDGKRWELASTGEHTRIY